MEEEGFTCDITVPVSESGRTSSELPRDQLQIKVMSREERRKIS